jgi:hypothetical protein
MILVRWGDRRSQGAESVRAYYEGERLYPASRHEMSTVTYHHV